MTGERRTAREVFDDWARDHHADGMERHHWPRVAIAFEEIEPSTGNYLEVGVGNGYGIRRMAEGPFARGRCRGVELSPEMTARARAKTADLDRVTIDRADFLEWSPPEAERYALIFSMEVFYYFAEIQRGIERAVDLLAPDGLLLVLVNFYEEHRASHGWPRDLDTPMQLWSAANYRDGFEAAGLVDVRQRRLRDGAAEPGDPGTLATCGRRRDDAS